MPHAEDISSVRPRSATAKTPLVLEDFERCAVEDRSARFLL
jgi:hypothetical protein